MKRYYNKKVMKHWTPVPSQFMGYNLTFYQLLDLPGRFYYDKDYWHNPHGILDEHTKVWFEDPESVVMLVLRHG